MCYRYTQWEAHDYLTEHIPQLHQSPEDLPRYSQPITLNIGTIGNSY
jgi:hypothetical protein